MKGNDAAEAATISVWWDMNDCPIPEGYDARRVRPRIERAFKKRGYSGPVSITAYGNQKEVPDHLLRGLSSTGVVVAHAHSEQTCFFMFSDMLEWLDRNPPAATMLLITNQVEEVFSWDLTRLQQELNINLFLAYSRSWHRERIRYVNWRRRWRWRKLLGSADREIICSETGELSAMFYCKQCKFEAQSLEEFRRHLATYWRHATEREKRNSRYREFNHVTATMSGRNSVAKPEYATAKIAVWWDMNDCPIPVGYDPRRVRPSMEGAFKNLGYSGPVSITAYADQTQTPEHILQGLSSTGVDVIHTNFDLVTNCISSDIREWRDDNPPPATMMVICNLKLGLSSFLLYLQQDTKYNLFLAYSHRPYKMSVLVTSAEWLWESLLAGVCLCSHHPETRRHVLQKCSGKGQSTGMFYCKSCYCDCKKSLDHFLKHLSGKDHALREDQINSDFRMEELMQDPSFRLRMIEQAKLLQEVFGISPRAISPRADKAKFRKSKRSRKAFGTGLRSFHNLLRLTNRRARC